MVAIVILTVVEETSHQISVRSFIILRSGEGLTFSNKDNSAILGKNAIMKHFRFSFSLKCAKKLINQIYYSYLFLSSNQKVSIN